MFNYLPPLPPFPPKSVFMRYMEKYGKMRQATADNIIRRMRFALWITKTTNIHTKYVILLLLHCYSCCTNAP